MLAQRLRHRVDVQEKVVTRTTGGEVTGHSWADAYTNVPAEVLTGPGRELIAAESKLAETSARITLRWFPGLDPAMRILWDGRVYDITSMETDATGRMEWRLRCRDGVSDGA